MRKIRIVPRMVIRDENGRLIGSASIQFRVIIEKLENRNDDRREIAINHGHTWWNIWGRGEWKTRGGRRWIPLAPVVENVQRTWFSHGKKKITNAERAVETWAALIRGACIVYGP